MERLIIKKFLLGIMSTNCYLIENNNHSILIDPGDKAELLINYLTHNNLQLTAILLTHGHFDHIGAIDELVEKFDVDSIRYFMIANGPEKKDTNFTEELYVQAHNKFLVGMLGNFVNRNLSFINKKFDGIIKEATVDPEIVKMTENLYKKVGNLIEQAELKAAIDEIFDYIGYANKYYDEKEPWKKAKEDIEEFNNITYTCTYIIANISNLIAPFMPNTSKKIKKMLSLPEFKWEPINIKGDIKVNELELLFNRIDLE